MLGARDVRFLILHDVLRGMAGRNRGARGGRARPRSDRKGLGFPSISTPRTPFRGAGSACRCATTVRHARSKCASPGRDRGARARGVRRWPRQRDWAERRPVSARQLSAPVFDGEVPGCYTKARVPAVAVLGGEVEVRRRIEDSAAGNSARYGRQSAISTALPGLPSVGKPRSASISTPKSTLIFR